MVDPAPGTKDRGALPIKVAPKSWVIRIYDRESNMFGAYNANGTTRPFYAPDPAVHGYPTNLDYWLSQPDSALWGLNGQPISMPCVRVPDLGRSAVDE